uniref:Zinc finger protein 276 n=1 Tax=Pygocentrus nattereri TaxID=42514 RepID=A0AAR2L549_PYGNA
MSGQAVRRRRAEHSDTPAGPVKTVKVDKGATGQCRLCHGHFSTRRLRRVFGKPPDSEQFCRDFQRLLGVPLLRDPSLSQFICRTCYGQFYKCLAVLTNFRARVNLTPNSTITDRIPSPVQSDDSDLSDSAAIKTIKKPVKLKILQPKERKKPGPKPGWKKKAGLYEEGEAVVYTCHHQGCSAVYKTRDGLKKHIREHHEDVRERPCPHPGCNKVFMIDRYLQRHMKLIHTEVRNYVCEQCGQTFKQRKHLQVHQMRHSGAKPLQCEVCGFQCRQRASLKYHMVKHQGEEDLEFACALCRKRFEKAHNLNVHMSMVHPLLQGARTQFTTFL